MNTKETKIAGMIMITQTGMNEEINIRKTIIIITGMTETKREIITKDMRTNIQTRKQEQKITFRLIEQAEPFGMESIGRLKHWKITDFPLKIYVKESSSRYYKSAYNNYVKYALDVWRNADDRINYTIVNSKREFY